MFSVRSACLLATALLAAACGPDDDVKVQPLPSLAMLSPEMRAHVPVVTGVWRFAGWEVAAGDSASLQAPLPAFGALALSTQKRDSIGGSYLFDGGRAPLAGEVRRDSTIALVTYLAPGDGRFLAGTLSRDTLWLEIGSLSEPGRWPNGARAAFVRTPVATTPFARMNRTFPPLARVDTSRADTLARTTVPAPPAVTEPSERAARPAPERPVTPRPGPVTPPREPRPEPRPEIVTPPEPPPLLGVPVDGDTARDNVQF